MRTSKPGLRASVAWFQGNSVQTQPEIRLGNHPKVARVVIALAGAILALSGLAGESASPSFFLQSLW
jgi:hypothetical protein